MSDQTDLLGLPADAERHDPIHKGDLADVPSKKWAPLLADLLRVQETLFKRRGMANQEAFEVACAVVIATADYIGGRAAYIPRGDRLRAALRDAKMWREYDGNPATVERLAAEHKLTTIRVYAILKQQRALNVGRRQGRLPMQEPAEG